MSLSETAINFIQFLGSLTMIALAWQVTQLVSEGSVVYVFTSQGQVCYL
jgi:hypothetical protein